MTVCIAAKCVNLSGQEIVVGASDRMLTAGDIEFEPPLTKIYGLASHAVAMISGDAADQAEIISATRRRLAQGPVADVRSIVNIYSEEYAAHRRRVASSHFLEPLGLDFPTLKNGSVEPSILSNLVTQLQTSRLHTSAIIAGVDGIGSHIYVVEDPGIPRFCDNIGFAAIGYGQNHAESLFMFRQYSWQWTPDKALFLVYAAKKRAEVAPGVGRETDLFVILPAQPGVNFIPTEFVAELQKIYERDLEGHMGLTNKTQTEVVEFFKRVTQATNAQQQADQQPTPPPDN
jgi:20S proteasome alpha/beta subunit